jgi:hypothetical protein
MNSNSAGTTINSSPKRSDMKADYENQSKLRSIANATTVPSINKDPCQFYEPTSKGRNREQKVTAPLMVVYRIQNIE